MFRKSWLLISLLILAFILLDGKALNAFTTRTWTGTIGDWSDPANWGGTEPTQSDYAVISNGGTANITQTGEICYKLILGDSSANNKQGFVQMTSGSLLGSNGIGIANHSRFNQMGGSVTGWITLSTESEYNLTGGDINVASARDEYIGYSGSAYFNHTGGRNVANWMYLGKDASCSGQYNLSGTGELTAHNLYVGSSGTGVFKHTGGICTVNNLLLITGGSASIYTLDGTGSLTVKSGGIGSGIDIRGSVNSPSRFEWFTNNLTTRSLTASGVLAMGFDFDVNALKSGSLFHGTTFGVSGTLEITRGSTATQSGGNPISFGTLRVGSSTGAGSYRLLDNAQLSATNEYVGYYGIGSFEQSGGTNSIAGTLYIGYDYDGYWESPSFGTYRLSGNGTLTASGMYNGVLISNGRLEWFNKNGLTVSSLNVGHWGTLAIGFDFDTASLMDRSLIHGGALKGIYTASKPEADYGNMEITNGATATQGSNSICLLSLMVGSNTGNGNYVLNNSGQLTALGMEQIGGSQSGTSVFQQNGGTNTVSLLSIENNGRYELKGGTLAITSGFRNEGTLDCGNSAAVLSIPDGAILDLSQGNIINARNTSLNIPASSLLIVSPGLDPASIFKTFTNNGICHTIGTPLVIGLNSIRGIGAIEDHVTCDGSIYADVPSHTEGYFGYINLNNGLSVSGTVDLRYGSLTCNDTNSGISQGTLRVYDQYVGKSTTGVFSHSGGTNTVSHNLYLGYAPGVSGQYDLNGTLALTHDSEKTKEACEYIGCRGNGVVNHTAGTNQFTGSRMVLYLGYEAGSSGTYNLSGTGQLNLSYIESHSLDAYIYEYIGYNGAGTFNQSAGRHAFVSFTPPNEGVYIGFNTGSTGTYNLSGTGFFTPRTTYVSYHAGSSGSLNISDSATFTGSTLYLGYDSGSQGNCSISGGTVSIYNLYVGYSGSGTFTQSGGTIGTVDRFPNIFLATEPGSSATFNLNGGVLTAVSINKGAGTVIFNFGGGTLKSYGSMAEISIPMTLTGINGNANFDIYTATTTLPGVLSGPGGLNKLGEGTLTLKAKNSYSGDTTVQGGILRIEGGIDPEGSKLIDVKAGAKAIVKTTNINNPDLDIGTTGTGIFEIVNGTHVVGTISGTGTTKVDSAGILTAVSIVQNTLIIGGPGYASASSATTDSSAESVPEPASIVLLGIAVCGLVLARRRRR